MLTYNPSQRFEQRQLFDSFRDYDPWGRAGGGAPAGDVRRRDLLSRYIYPHQPAWRETKERFRPPLRPKHRPHLNFENVENIKNEYPKEPDIVNYGERGREAEGKFPRVIQPKVWSSNPWEGRGPWGRKGPGGLPWRAAGDVGRNFHHSMGWTTENTFHFPTIPHPTNKENVMHHILDADHRKKKKGDKIPPIKITAAKENDYMGERIDDRSWKTGGTPNEHLLGLTGGVELVPLMRARAWTYKQKQSDSDYRHYTEGIFHR